MPITPEITFNDCIQYDEPLQIMTLLKDDLSDSNLSPLMMSANSSFESKDGDLAMDVVPPFHKQSSLAILNNYGSAVPDEVNMCEIARQLSRQTKTNVISSKRKKTRKAHTTKQKPKGSASKRAFSTSSSQRSGR